MYIHLGKNTVVNVSEIVAIIDIDKTTTSKHTRNFLTAAQKKGEVVNVSDDLPKSAVVCKNKDKTRVYISQISPVTLQGRYKNAWIDPGMNNKEKTEISFNSAE